MTARELALETAIADMTRSAADAVPPKRQRSNSRIMYIEQKDGGLIGPARIIVLCPKRLKTVASIPKCKW